MAQFVYDIEGQALGIDPIGNGWTMRTSAGFGVSAIEAITTPVGTKAWRAAGDSGNSTPRIALLSAVPANTGTVEVLSLQRRADPLAGMGNVYRMDASGFLNGYFLGLRNNADQARGRHWSSDSPLEMGAVPHGLSAVDSWVWMRSQSDGSTHRLRVWIAGTPEPTTWILEQTDATVATGAVGIGDYTNDEREITVAWFSVGTDGDAAPAQAKRILITGIKEANLLNELATGVTGARAKVWYGATDAGAEEDLVSDLLITEGVLSVVGLPAGELEDAAIVEVMWKVGTAPNAKRQLLITEGTVVALGGES